jgi:hypothetical protein
MRSLRLVPAEASGVEEALAPVPEEEGVDGAEEDAAGEGDDVAAATGRAVLIGPEGCEGPPDALAASGGSTIISSGAKRLMASATRA